jgi:hypothetical protein
MGWGADRVHTDRQLFKCRILSIPFTSVRLKHPTFAAGNLRSTDESMEKSTPVDLRGTGFIFFVCILLSLL